jgi:hypothetical protein
MRTVQFSSKSLVALFQRQRIATMQDLKKALGTKVDRTVFRKLREVPYFTSYSHRGKYYAIHDFARFDERGLWTHRGVHFSLFGSLVGTAEQFVVHSERGYLCSELTEELQVQTKETLLKLVSAERLTREKVSGLYLYCSPDPTQRRQQLLQRGIPNGEEPFAFLRDPLIETSDETKAAIILFFSTLDERQRRLYAGLESLRLGHSGDSALAELTGLDVHTIAKGRQELVQRDVDLSRIRRPGGGRKPVEKKRQR